MKYIIKLCISFQILALLLIACANQPLAHRLQGDKPPLPVIQIGETEIKAVRASYCWQTGCVDTVGPPDILTDVKPALVEPGEQLHLYFDYQPKPSSLSVSRLKEGEETWHKETLANGYLEIPQEQGIYYYDLFAVWSSANQQYSTGDAYYAFVIEVK